MTPTKLQITTIDDVVKNINRLLKIIGAKKTSGGKIRGFCPSCGYDSFEVFQSQRTKKIVWGCNNNSIDDKDEHRWEIEEELHSKRIFLEEYYPLPVTEIIFAEFPFFKLDRKKDLSVRIFEYKDIKIELIPSVLGHPTAWDEPLYLFAVRLSKDEFGKTGRVPEWVEFHVLDYLRWIEKADKEITGERARAIEGGLKRMKGLQVVSTIKYGTEQKLVQGEGIITGWKFGKRCGLDSGMAAIRLADWTRIHIQSNRIIHLPEDFFCLPPIERKIYQILHKHLGRQKQFIIGIENLRTKSGYERDLRRFRYDIKGIIPSCLDIGVEFLEYGNIRVKRIQTKNEKPHVRIT
uniref:Uncharacterized protein n=1 Tax=Leptospirillum ferrodiazotrophum TaxID=412449 RepID=C6HZD5_9BACT|nr:MAG: hypothetical protein UBAL3_94580001 [Leptospirillum ferrodiazotrophum]